MNSRYLRFMLGFFAALVLQTGCSTVETNLTTVCELSAITETDYDQLSWTTRDALKQRGISRQEWHEKNGKIINKDFSIGEAMVVRWIIQCLRRDE